jgi:hypothetical protein
VGTEKKRIIMVMGVQRSGTNVLFQSLSASPGVSAFNESEDNPFFASWYLKPVNEVRRAVEEYPGVIVLKPITETRARSVAEVLTEFREFDVQVVWLYRDPVNVYYSHITKWDYYRQSGPGRFVAEWNRRNRSVIDAAQYFRNRILIVRYEDLIDDPAVFEGLCRALKLDGEYEFWADSQAGRKNLQADVQRTLDEGTRRILLALHEIRSFLPTVTTGDGDETDPSDEGAVRSEINRMRAEIRRLDGELARERFRRKTVESTTSYGIGRAIVMAFKFPGKHTLALPGELWKAFRSSRLPRRRGIRQTLRRKLKKPLPRPSTRVLGETERRELLRGFQPCHSPTIATITTVLLGRQLAQSCGVRSMHPNTWPYVLEKEHPALLLIQLEALESGQWGHLNVPGGKHYWEQLGGLVRRCRETKVPVVVWDTEGRRRMPPALEALPVDLCLTTNRQTSASDGRNQREWEFLPSAVDPRIFNPLNRGKPGLRFCFAGSFDRRNNSKDLDQLRRILEAAQQLGLEIFDDYHGFQGPGVERVQFPGNLANRCVGSSAGIQGRLQEFHTAICANPAGSQSGSLSERALQALACGLNVVSTPLEVEALPPAVRVIQEPGRIDRVLQEILAEEPHSEKWWKSFRYVLREHSLTVRLHQLFERMGLESPTVPMSVGVLGLVQAENAAEMFFEQVDSQSLRPDRIAVAAASELSAATTDRCRTRGISVRQIDAAGSVLKQAIRALETGTLCVWDSQADWDPFHLEDLRNALVAVQAQAATRNAGRYSQIYEFGTSGSLRSALIDLSGTDPQFDKIEGNWELSWSTLAKRGSTIVRVAQTK